MLKTSLIIAAGILSVTSIAAPVAHWWSIPTSTIVQVFTAAAAGGVGVAKLALFPTASHLWKTHRSTAMACFVFASLFMAVSIDTSTKYLESQTQSRNSAAASQSDLSQALRAEIAQIDASITNLNGLIKSASDNGYRSQAGGFQSDLSDLMSDRRKAVKSLANQKGGKTAELTGFGFGAYGAFIVALSFHLGSAVCLMALTGLNAGKRSNDGLDQEDKQPETVQKQTKTEPKQVKQTAPKPKQADRVIEQGSRSEPKLPVRVAEGYTPKKFKGDEIISQIISGRYGNPMTIRDANEEYVGAFDKFKKVILEPLLQQQKLDKRGDDLWIIGLPRMETQARKQWAEEFKRKQARVAA